jgi:DNA-binding NarL/FixJ family response regulator
MSDVRVLLADDHALVRAGIRNSLKSIPNLSIVGEVGDGPSLLGLLAHAKPDLLLVDVTMPDFEPVAAIQQIRNHYPGMRILVISAYDDDVYVQGLLSAGVDGYLLKDQSLADLQLAVQRILSGEKWVSGRLVDKLVSYAETPTMSPPSTLTARQHDILRLLQQGFDNQTIAQHMNLSVKTIENHLTRLYRQLHVQSRLEAVNYANKHPEVLALSGQTVAHIPLPTDIPEQGCVTLLIVDDNTRYRHQLRRMIGKVCSQTVIYEAENIDETIDLIKRIMPQLVLVDVVLGEEDGICCTRRIKALSSISRVVLISAYPDREFHRLGLEAGAVAFLDKKDLDAAALRQLINDVAA